MKIILPMNYDKVARHFSSLLVLMYGLVPMGGSFLGIYPQTYATINFVFSICLIGIIYLLPSDCKGRFTFSLLRFNTKPIWLVLVFIISAYVFHLFPWTTDRGLGTEASLGTSIAALMRALWLLTGITYVNKTEKQRFFILILTIILMYIDRSRTYFLVLLLILAAKSSHKKSIIVISLASAIFLAAIRSGASTNGLNSMLFGIVGEGLGATTAVGQIYGASIYHINVFMHLFETFFQPVVFPFDFVATKIFGTDYLTQGDYLARLVMNHTNEVFNPMGGWYIVADFVYYGYFGIFLMWIYIVITWFCTKLLLDDKDFPFGSFFFFIAIKASPFVYWKFIYYILFISLIYRALNKLSLLPSRRSSVPIARGHKYTD
jgi:hypothetical protein